MSNPHNTIPRSAALAALLAVALFVGGYAAAQGLQNKGAGDRYRLEREAAPRPGGVGVVTPDQVLAAGLDRVQLVDVRTREAFDFAHAVGAVSMPESEVAETAPRLPRDRTLVLYCTCPDEKTSLRAARTLADVYGLTNVVALKGGLIALKEAGAPMSSDATSSAIEHQGCGCEVEAPAFKLWAINLAEARLKEQQAQE